MVCLSININIGRCYRASLIIVKFKFVFFTSVAGARTIFDVLQIKLKFSSSRGERQYC